MSRSLPVWLLASALAAFVGCGGGAATDSGAVASSSNEAASSSGGPATPTGDSGGTQAPGGMMGGMTGGPPPGGAEGTGEPSADMMQGYSTGGPPGGADASTDPAAGMSAAYGPGGEGYPAGAPGGAGADPDMDAMAAAYGAGGEGPPGPGATTGTSPEDMAAQYGAGAGAPGAEGAYPGGSYPGGENSTGPGGEGAYPGGGYPGGPGGPGGGAVEEQVPEGFDGQAQLAFRRGKEKDAMQYLYAHALTTDAGAQSLVPTIRWVAGLREPKLAVRWGAGFVVTAPRNFNGDPKPVGSQQDIPTRGGSRGNAAGGDESFAGAGGAADYGTGEGGGGGGANDSLLKKGAGELGEKLVAAYTERLMRGNFGDVLKKAAEAGSGGNRGNAGGEGYDVAGYAGAGGPDPTSAGPGYGAKAGPESAGSGGGAGAAALTQVTRIMTGLSMLGIGTEKELIERARDDGIDVVVIVDVELQVNTKTGLVTNNSTLSLLDVKSPKKPLHKTKKFNNIAIQKARADGKEDNVDREMEALFEAIDAKLKMTDLPAILTAEIAANRVASLAKEKRDNPLPVLVEARMYHSKGLLEESALFAAYEEILGVDYGRQLATGTEEDKKKALDRWLPES